MMTGCRQNFKLQQTLCVCAASSQTLPLCCLPLSKLTANKWSTTRVQTRMCCAANVAVDVAVAPLYYSCNKWAHKMHCRAAQQTTPKNKPRKRQLAKNATDRQQTERRTEEQKERQTDRQQGRTESNPYSWWTLAACGPCRVRNNHPVQMPMWPQGGKGRERVKKWEWERGSAVVKGNMWLILRLPHPPKPAKNYKLHVEWGIHYIQISVEWHESKCILYKFSTLYGLHYCVYFAEATFNSLFSHQI